MRATAFEEGFSDVIFYGAINIVRVPDSDEIRVIPDFALDGAASVNGTTDHCLMHLPETGSYHTKHPNWEVASYKIKRAFSEGRRVLMGCTHFHLKSLTSVSLQGSILPPNAHQYLLEWQQFVEINRPGFLSCLNTDLALLPDPNELLKGRLPNWQLTYRGDDSSALISLDS